MSIFVILLVLFSLVALLVLHELGHFLVAKKFNVEVEEFGVGYPPRIIGKKFGETLYSLNLLPFGAFVKIAGENREKEGPGTFHNKPIWQRALILLGGVVTFWIIAFLLFSIIATAWGFPTAVSDDFQGNAFVRVALVSEESPAKKAGIRMGDEIVKMGNEGEVKKIEKISELQDFIDKNKGEKISVFLKRDEEIIQKELTPRVSPPKGEGEMGVALARVTYKKYPWYQAPLAGASMTARKTYQIPVVLFSVAKRALKGKQVQGVKLSGPVGIGKIMGQSLQQGWGRFLIILSGIAVWLALFNILPIPALDGGRLLFLLVEKIKGSPIKKGIEEKVNMVFFVLLVGLMIFVTIKDIIGLF